jgi:hypothetical protein
VKKSFNFYWLSVCIFLAAACSKNTSPNDPCAGVTITVNGTTTNPAAGASNGTIIATASGSSGFTYSINNGAFQSTGQFTNLAAGNYTITAKSSSGCIGTASFTLTNTVTCSGVTITTTPTATGVTPCVNASGSINVTATGGTAPYTFSLNGGAFQSVTTFSNLNAGTYNIAVKDANGCNGTQASVVVGTRSAGPLFTAVKNLIQTNCVSCHNAQQAGGGVNLSNDCAIVSAKDRIRARAVDGVPSPMPTGGLLPSTERQKITDWINAGGRVTD